MLNTVTRIRAMRTVLWFLFGRAPTQLQLAVAYNRMIHRHSYFLEI